MSYPGFDLTGRTAVVVGGTSGIGRAIAHGLAQAGADVVCTSRRIEEVEKAAGEIEALGRKTIRCSSDVSNRESIENLLSESVAAFGKVDILVNSAGRTKREPTLDVNEEDWNAILETNLTGTLRTCQAFGRHMIGNGYGRIINIASLSTFVSLFEVAAYSASKAAVASLTKSLAIEWAKQGVNVNAIAPGVFRTALNTKLSTKRREVRNFSLERRWAASAMLKNLPVRPFFLRPDAASYVTGEVLVGRWRIFGERCESVVVDKS
jgi:NAD(P)-dependent dehydrogenase (short-subunit alcohol dehydrogenase family)